MSDSLSNNPHIDNRIKAMAELADVSKQFDLHDERLDYDDSVTMSFGDESLTLRPQWEMEEGTGKAVRSAGWLVERAVYTDDSRLAGKAGRLALQPGELIVLEGAGGAGSATLSDKVVQHMGIKFRSQLKPNPDDPHDTHEYEAHGFKVAENGTIFHRNGTMMFDPRAVTTPELSHLQINRFNGSEEQIF